MGDSYGRGGSPYRYYIAMTLQVGRTASAEQRAIHRLAAPAVEEFLVRELRRLGGSALLEVADLNAVVRRVEVRSECIHLVVNCRALFGDEHPETALGKLRGRLDHGERIVAEPNQGPRIVLTRRLQFRGGRTTIIGGEQEARRQLNPGIVAALKRAHVDLAALHSSPTSTADELMAAAAPATQYDRQLSRLAFLAPRLQLDILAGAQPRGLALRAFLRTDCRSPGQIRRPGWRRSLFHNCLRFWQW